MKFTIPLESIPTCAYRDVLFNRCTADQLRRLAKVYDVTIKQSASKRQLADTIEKAWLEQTEARLLIFPQKELLALQRLVKADGYLAVDDILETDLLEDFRVIQVEDDMDDFDDTLDEDELDELDNALNELDDLNELDESDDLDDELADEGYSEDIRYAIAKNLREAIAPIIDKLVNDARVLKWDQKSMWLMNLLECYGILSLSNLEAISQEVTGDPITILDVQYLLIKRNLRENYINGFLLNKELHLASGLIDDPEGLFEIVLQRKNLRYAIFPKERYLEPGIVKMTPPDAKKAVNAMMKFLKQVNHKDEQYATIQMLLLWNAIQLGISIRDAANIITEDETPMSPRQYETFRRLMVDMAELMPLWVLKGHTPKELGLSINMAFDNKPNAKSIKAGKSKRSSSKQASIYQLRIQLEDIEPPIWRCLLVPSDMALEDLHKVIQVSMGWTNSHLHEFTTKHHAYIPSWSLEEDFRDPGYSIAYEDICLNQLLRKKDDHVVYEYDYGDSWEHRIDLEDIQPYREGLVLPVCLDGARQCPPEDCGGTFGYKELLNILKNPKHPEYKHMKSWIGRHFDPEAFDRALVNDLLQQPNYGLIEWEEDH